MLVQLPEDKLKNSANDCNTNKKWNSHFKEDIGADSTFLNKKQTYNYLGISNNTLDIGIAMGLPYIRIGKSISFNKKSINQWMTRLEISA